MKADVIIEGVSYFKKVSQDYENAEFLNRRLQKLRDFVNDIYHSFKIHEFNFELYFFESDDLNAVSFFNNGNCVIGFSIASFTIIYDKLKDAFSKSEVLTSFGIRDTDIANIDFSVRAAFDYATYFLVLHEFYHIVNGHCGYRENKGFFCSEQWTTFDENDCFESQVFECNADCKAVQILTFSVLVKWAYYDSRPKDEKLQDLLLEYKYLAFSIYLIFLLFSRDPYDTFEDCLSNLLVYDHPFASLRMHYSLIMFVTQAGRVLSPIQEAIFYHDVFNLCIAYDRIYYANGKFKNSLGALSGTEAGITHIKKLLNGWNNYVKKLEPYCYTVLEENEILDKMPFYVNDRGENQTEVEYTN